MVKGRMLQTTNWVKLAGEGWFWKPCGVSNIVPGNCIWLRKIDYYQNVCLLTTQRPPSHTIPNDCVFDTSKRLTIRSIIAVSPQDSESSALLRLTLLTPGLHLTYCDRHHRNFLFLSHALLDRTLFLPICLLARQQR
jgi:hypothetical protein